ncbi:hypothetical protein J3R30DRAFT_3851336 [Lentinula aciculospora]|uniref:Glucose-methanol-choline oxidoreductase N-terminal domain-containing protein n=1 Tax=Lentinula aciculospora TaxID=153920 RepID=A0A9W9DRC0_9AGAR|nr:hypothetical protein J3R30DRAFT_3851336 [Lentinula aciculospora]
MWPHKTYDIIFAGGGTTACVVAGRLAQADPSLKILVIEAGPHTRNLNEYVQPAQSIRHIMHPGKSFTHHKAIPTEALCNKSISLLSASCLGGGSSVNLMMYTRAAASDFDDWEKLGNPGWGSKDLIPLARKAETYQVPKGDPAVHGFTGPIKVSCGGYEGNIGRDFLEAARAYDRERQSSVSLADSMDSNDFRTTDVYGFCTKPVLNLLLRTPPVLVWPFQSWYKYIDARTGKRSDTAHHFIYRLLDEGSQNLRILTDRRVVRVLIENNRAVGVEYLASGNVSRGENLQCSINTAQPEIAYASRLVVISSGAFGSPAILERSGIGSLDHLAESQVHRIVDLPGVGENYQDHNLMLIPYLSSKESDCIDAISDSVEEVIKLHLPEWIEKGSGFLATNSVDAGIKLRPTPDDLKELGPPFKQLWNDYFVSAPDKPVMILAISHGNVSTTPSPPKSKIFTMIYYTMYPCARGYTHITSGIDPWAPLKINPRYLEDSADVAVLRWGYKHARELARRMKSFRGEIPNGNPDFGLATMNNPSNTESSTASIISTASSPINPNAPDIVYSTEDDRTIDEHIRQNVSTTWHSLGTCAMKPRSEGGVIDSRLNVYGVGQLKVADLSIAPLNVGANTYNTALIIGEKAFLIIAEDLGIQSRPSASSPI